MDSLFFIFSRILEKRTPIKRPKNIPPHTIHAKLKNHQNIAPEVTSQERIIHKITKKNARAVPSLKMLSHSNIRASLRGAPTVLKIESTATGSVADIREPNKRHTRNGICNPRSGKIK